MSWEKLSDLYIPGMQESRAQSVHFALRGTHATAWGDAGSAEASSCWERRLLMCLLVSCVADGLLEGGALCQILLVEGSSVDPEE